MDSYKHMKKNYREYFENKWGKDIANQLLAKSSVS